MTRLGFWFDGVRWKLKLPGIVFAGESEYTLPSFAIAEGLDLVRLDIVALFRVKQKKLFTAATLGAAVTRNRRQSLF